MISQRRIHKEIGKVANYLRVMILMTLMFCINQELCAEPFIRAVCDILEESRVFPETFLVVNDSNGSDSCSFETQCDDGTRRCYQRIDRLPSSLYGEVLLNTAKEREANPYYFRLVNEKLAHGNEISYNYDADGNVSFIKINDPILNETLSWMHFSYGEQDDITVTTNDKQEIEGQLSLVISDSVLYKIEDGGTTEAVKKLDLHLSPKCPSYHHHKCRGPTGPTGPKGATGAPGPDGATGATGATGAAGGEANTVVLTVEPLTPNWTFTVTSYPFVYTKVGSIVTLSLSGTQLNPIVTTGDHVVGEDFAIRITTISPIVGLITPALVGSGVVISPATGAPPMLATFATINSGNLELHFGISSAFTFLGTETYELRFNIMYKGI
jgi:YD repeat-containing protein